MVDKFQDALHLAGIVREKSQAEEAKNSLRAFTKACWPVLSPGVPYAHNWHIDCLIEHLEAMAKRQIMRLIINIPPRSLKSSLISVIFPAWRWLNAPEEKFLTASFSRPLSLRDSRRTRNLIISPWYQNRWSSIYSLSNDQNEKGRFENDKGGFRLACSVEGGVIGEGGSFTIYDDPNDLDKMQFEEYRQGVKEWYSGVASSRFINPRTDVRLCVQQRASYGDDLTSYLLELGGWEHLVIPNEFEGERKVSSIGWSDPRTHMGELMHPERLGQVEIERLKVEQRDNYAGQYQQRPSSLSGGRLKKEWFNFWNPAGSSRTNELGNIVPVNIKIGSDNFEKIPLQLPEAFEQVVQSWDMAFKDEEQNSKVAGQAWGRVGAKVFLLKRDTRHRNFPETLSAVRSMSYEFPCPEKLVEGKANGPAVIQTLRNEIPGLIEVEPEGGKFARVAAISGYVEAGNVYLPNPDIFPWVWDLLEEFAGTPKDDTDSATQAMKRLFDSMAQSGVPEFRVQPRVGEPQNACHIVSTSESFPSHWRRFVSVIPSLSAVWLIETPSGAIRVVRELSLDKLDAFQVGREIAKKSLVDLLGRPIDISSSKRVYEIFLPKPAFAPVEPIGSYAELLEQGVLSFESEDGDWDLRQDVKEAIKSARFRAEMVESEEDDQGALDRLRSLMAFSPPDFQKVPYDRKKALSLADQDLAKYAEYMSATEGEVRGEWPKLKISPVCKELISQLGGFRRDRVSEAPGMVKALLQGVCVPMRFKAQELKVVKIPTNRDRIVGRKRFGRR